MHSIREHDITIHQIARTFARKTVAYWLSFVRARDPTRISLLGPDAGHSAPLPRLPASFLSRVTTQPVVEFMLSWFLPTRSRGKSGAPRVSMSLGYNIECTGRGESCPRDRFLGSPTVTHCLSIFLRISWRKCETSFFELQASWHNTVRQALTLFIETTSANSTCGWLSPPW